MFHSLTLKHKLIILAGLPLILALAFGFLLIKSASTNKSNADNIQLLLNLAVANSELVHELQKERGLTAGFIGSKGNDTFKQKLISQRRSTDNFKTSKLTINNELADVIKRLGLETTKNDNIAVINQIENIRQRVDQQNISLAEALGFYTNLNASLLNVIATIADIAKSPEVKQQSLAYYNFTQAKERAGIERAVLSDVFATNNFNLQSYAKFTKLVLLQDTYLKEFENIADSKLVAMYKNEMNAPAIKDVNAYRAIADEKNLQGQFNVDAVAWFDSATKRINVLKDIENNIAAHVKTLALTQAKAASSANLLYFITIIIFSLICIFIALHVIKGINRKVNSLISTLNYCSENKALDKTIAVEGQDEFSNIFTALNQVLTNFKSAIIDLASSSENLAASSGQNSVAVEQSSVALMQQKEQTYLVATAVEEMSQTIQEVSRNTNDTASAAAEAEKMANEGAATINESINQIKMVASDVAQVHQLISTLNDNTNQITNVVDVIKSVAEQTNLLALNAAIEAARAGEQGRGFAVVADEVRTLAQRTQESTRQIESIISTFTDTANRSFTLIEGCQENANLSVSQASNMTALINNIKNAIATISQMTEQIATASEEQVVVASDIGKTIVEISAAADESADAAKQIAQTSHSQANLARNLKELSGSFVV